MKVFELKNLLASKDDDTIVCIYTGATGYVPIKEVTINSVNHPEMKGTAVCIEAD